MTEYEVTLEQMLLAKDNRAENQHKLITTYALPLISFTVNMPGPKKNTIYSRRIFHEGCRVLISVLKNKGICPIHQETKELPSGMEKYIIVDMDEYALKKLALETEEQHPLGRLWDFDIINKDGMPLSREALGYPMRKCLLCDNQAHACARSKAHTLPEVLDKIHKMTDKILGTRY